MIIPLKRTGARGGLSSNLAGACVAFFLLVLGSTQSVAQMGADNATTSIQRGTEAAKALQEPSYQTREERLNAKPLDWNSTLGKPTPRKLTPAEREALRRARPGSAEGGAPNPNAAEEARRLHPDDWR
jgi:hypothetical protein